MKILGMSLILAGALLASDYSYEVSPMVGGVKAEGNLDIENQKAYGLRFQMNDLNLMGLVPEISFDHTTSTDYENNLGSTYVNRLAFNGLYDCKDFSEKITPYLLAGIGYEDATDELNGYEDSVYGNYGAGVKWKVLDDIALRAEVKHLLRFDDGGNELYYGIGLSIPFGKKSADAEPLDGDHDGVLDGDNDGVVDALDQCPESKEGSRVDENGCAEIVVLDVHFKTSSAEIDTKHTSQLEKFANFMNDNQAYRAVISGHTDSRGSAEMNKKLSLARAESVKNDLANRGVDSSRITTAGHGEEQPVADNTTAEGRALNRRIEAQLKR